MYKDIDVLAGRCLGDFRLPDDMDIVVDHGRGARIWDTDGTEYIDYLLGSGPMVLGHAHPRVVNAVREQVGRGTTFYSVTVPVIELARRVVDSVPCADSVRFVADGSEATFYALRLARAHTGKDRVLKFEGGFHGHHDYGLQSFAPDVAGQLVRPQPDTAGIPQGVTDSVLVARFNDLASVECLLSRHSDEVAAILVEPIQRAIEPQPGFLQGLRTLCDRYGCVLVFDEVVTGFRLARGGAQEWYGVIPDLCTLGKVMGGGLPIAAVAGRAEIMDLVTLTDGNDRYVYMNGTLNGNPLAAVAGLAALEVMEEENGYERLSAIGTVLCDGLRTAARELEVPLTVIGPPAFPELLFGEGTVDNYEDYRRFDHETRARFAVELIHRGIYLRPGAKIYISLAHTDNELQRTLDAASDVLRLMRGEGLFERWVGK